MRRQVIVGVWSMLFLGWLSYMVAGVKLSQVLAARCGDALLRFGQGKFNDPALFIHRRGSELLWLGTLAAFVATVHLLLDRVLRQRGGAGRWRWAAHATVGFGLLNLWVGAAGHTALFWGTLGACGGLQNLIQFHFKRIMLEESAAPARAVLVGNSQTRAQIDESVLNERLGTNLWTTELHFPGSHGYDLLLIERQLRRAHPQFVICYLSESYFYNGSAGETVPNFFALADLSDSWRRGAVRHLERKGLFYGILGDVLPLFRYREVFAQCLLGSSAVQLKQAQYDTALAADLETRARDAAGSFRLGDECEFQKRAFEDFVVVCQRASRHIIVLDGQCNPMLTRHLNPAVRADLKIFLNQLKSKCSNLVVVDLDALPQQSFADYEDLTHVNSEAQRRFTLWLADFMEKQLFPPEGSTEPKAR
jgi:hypothetical protein